MNKPPADVRMKGFKNRSTVAEAFEWIDEHAGTLQSEELPVPQGFGRILSEDIRSEMNVPSFRRSSMDGYAIRGLDSSGASEFSPLEFQLIGQSLPAQGYNGSINKGEAVEIMTGAPVPEGADAVIPVEYTQKEGMVVSVSSSVSPGKNVAEPGEDIQKGSVVLSTGRCLRPQDVGLLASLGISHIQAVRQPKIRLITTGQELVEPGTKLEPGQIYDSNSPMLRSLVSRDGGIMEEHSSLAGLQTNSSIEKLYYPGDDRVEIRKALLEEGADIILVSGGSSVGKEDHAPSIVAEEGELGIHGIAMRPSSPTGIGKIGNAIVFLLPGNPVSCLCAYDFFARRAMQIMGFRPTDWPYTSRELKVKKKIVSAIGRLDYCRVCVVDDEVEPVAISGASILSSTTKADGFVIVPEEYEGYPPGSNISVFLYDR